MTIAYQPKCAVCWIDKKTGRRGTNRTTQICAECQKDPANADWIAKPACEGPDGDEDEDDEPSAIDQYRTPYDTPLARAILRRIAAGDTLEEAAVACKSKLGYAKHVAAYWNRVTGGKLNLIRDDSRNGKPLKPPKSYRKPNIGCKDV